MAGRDLLYRPYTGVAFSQTVMKKYLLIISITLYYAIQPAVGCDVCGCSVSGGFSSVLPQFQKNFIGLRSSFARFESRHTDDHHVSDEKSHTTELWARYYPHKRIQLIASLPYHSKQQQGELSSYQVRGWGDLVLNVNYTVLNRNRDSFKWKHLWLLGAGVKLPTGKTNFTNAGEELNPSIQPGSGSLDYLYNTSYAIRYKKVGLSNDLQYRLNYENRDKYAFGNKLSLSSRIFYWKKFRKNCNVVPGTGVLIEKMDKDYQAGYVQAETGGRIDYLTAGCEVYLKRFFFSCQYLYPFEQNLANGYIKALPKLQFNSCFIF
jgi:hypothetical protein